MTDLEPVRPYTQLTPYGSRTSLSKSIGRSPPRHIHNPSELMFFTRWSGQRISTVFILGAPHEREIYVRLQRVDVMFSIVYPDSDNALRPVQERRILYLDLADYERLR